VRRTLDLLVAGSLSFGLLSGCDPSVKSTILGGFEALASSFVTAGFQQAVIDSGFTPIGSNGSTTSRPS
jgi:hypothetical protein